MLSFWSWWFSELSKQKYRLSKPRNAQPKGYYLIVLVSIFLGFVAVAWFADYWQTVQKWPVVSYIATNGLYPLWHIIGFVLVYVVSWVVYDLFSLRAQISWVTEPFLWGFNIPFGLYAIANFYFLLTP